MGFSISVEDLIVFNPDLDPKMGEILIKDGMALARRVAPCIDDDDFPFADAAVAIIRGAILRWADSGSGALSSDAKTAGPFSQTTTYDTRQQRRTLFYPSEISELQKLCMDANSGGAFAIDTAPRSAGRCLREYDGCSYLFGTTSSPCTACGQVMRPGAWEV